MAMAATEAAAVRLHPHLVQATLLMATAEEMATAVAVIHRHHHLRLRLRPRPLETVATVVDLEAAGALEAAAMAEEMEAAEMEEVAAEMVEMVETPMKVKLH